MSRKCAPRISVAGFVGMVLLLPIGQGWAAESAVMSFEGVESWRLYAKAVKQLTSGIRLGDLVLSPDGRHVLALEKGTSRLWLVDLQDGRRRKVADALQGGFQHSFCWSPEGKRLLYVAAGGATYLVSFAGQDLMAAKLSKKPIGKVLGERVEVLWGKHHGWAYWREIANASEYHPLAAIDEPSTLASAAPQVTTDGSAVFVSVGGRRRRIAGRGFRPKVLAGERILYSTADSSKNYRYVECDLDGGRRIRMLGDPGKPLLRAGGTSSPDGSLFLVEAPANDERSAGLYVLDSSGANTGSIPMGRFGIVPGWPQWFPDGERVAVADKRGGGGIFIVELALREGTP